MGIGTFGLSEAFRPMLGGGNRDLMDNIGTMGIAGAPGLFVSEAEKQQKQQANTPGTNMVAGSQPRQIS